MAEPDLPEGQALHSVALQVLQQALADRPVHHLVGMGRIAEQVGQIHDVQARRELREERVAGHADVDRAEPDTFQDGAVAAQFARRMHAHRELASGLLLQEFGHVARRLVMRIVG